MLSTYDGSVLYLNSTELHCVLYRDPSSQPLPPVRLRNLTLRESNDLPNLPSQLMEKVELGIGLLPPSPPHFLAHLAYAVCGISPTSQERYPGLESRKEV